MIKVELKLPRVAVAKTLAGHLINEQKYFFTLDEDLCVVINGHDNDVVTEVFMEFLYFELKSYKRVKQIIPHQGPSIIKETVDELNRKTAFSVSFTAKEIDDLIDTLRQNLDKEIETAGSYSYTMYTVQDLSSLALALLNRGYKKQ